MLSEISPDESGIVNELKYVVTEQAIAQIFRKKPQVAMEYRKWLFQHRNSAFPAGISIEDVQSFWTRYIAIASRQTKPGKGQSADQNIFASLKLDDMVVFDSVSRLRRYRALEPAVLLGPLQECHPGSGVLNKEELPSDYGKTIEPMNTHSERVLIEIGAIPDTTSRDSEIRLSLLPKAVPIDHLVENPPPVLKPLNVSQQKTVMAADPAAASILAEASQTFLSNLDEYALNFVAIPPAPEISDRESECVFREMMPSETFAFDFGTMKEESKLVRAQLD
jgi:hypothetical protein